MPDPIFSTNYLWRAAMEFTGLLHGTNEMQAVYGDYIDSNGKPLQGDRKYEAHFQSPPPIQEFGFWSVTLYDIKNRLFADNPIERYSKCFQSFSLLAALTTRRYSPLTKL